MHDIIPVSLEDELQSSYLEYAMSVIISRAIPDARDGLKPVQRRILYAMYNIKNFHDQPTKKSARVVGEVIGKFHPHGDIASIRRACKARAGLLYEPPAGRGPGKLRFD